jgi:tetratricopeptide (TPR) repeat protein
VLAEIISRTHCPNPISRLALSGPGGVGYVYQPNIPSRSLLTSKRRKSQVAIEYAYRTREASPDTWVFWVHAGSVFQLENDYRSIAKAFRLPGWDEEGTDIFKIVHDWLSDEVNGKWVMILDNADDLDVFTAAPPHRTTFSSDNSRGGTVTRQIRSFLPKSSTGSILITSVSKNVAFELTGNSNHCLELTEMSESEALLLFKAKIKGTYSEDDILTLLRTLEYVPLAISQAAAAINQGAPRETVVSYTEKAKSEDATALLEASAFESHRDAERSNSVVVTWQINFRYIRQNRPSAARLLSLICLFDRQRIEEALLWGNYGKEPSALIPVPVPPMNRLRRKLYVHDLTRRIKKERGRGKAAINEFGKDWGILNDYSFIKTNASGDSFSMHRLVQLTAQRWLERNEELEMWVGRYMSVMDHRYRQLGVDNVLMARLLYPHLRQVVTYKPSDREDLVTWASIMKMASEFALIKSDMGDARMLSKKAFDVVKNELGMENEVTLQYAERYRRALYNSGNFDEAEPLCREIFELRTKLLGQHHTDTLHSMQTLGRTWCRQGKEKEGTELLFQAIKLNKVSQEEENTWVMDFLTAVPDLVERGEYLLAEQRLRALYPAGRRVHGSWDLIAYMLTNQLALVAKLQEKFPEAEQLYRQVLTEKELGGTVDAESSVNLAGVLERTGKEEEAERLYRRALQFYTKRDEGVKDEAIETMACLASTLVKRGVFDEAEELSRQVLELRKDAIGAFHDRWIATHSLAVILEQQGHLEEALIHYKTAHEGMANICGDLYFDTKAYLEDYTTLKEKVAAKHVSSEQDELQPACATEG